MDKHTAIPQSIADLHESNDAHLQVLHSTIDISYSLQRIRMENHDDEPETAKDAFDKAFDGVQEILTSRDIPLGILQNAAICPACGVNENETKMIIDAINAP